MRPSFTAKTCAALLGIALFCSSALAQESSAPARTYTLTVTEADLQALSAAIGELPTKIGMPLMVKLQQQVTAQSKPKEDASQKPK